MPIVRSPCTFEWPRTGQIPAPGLPKLPRSSSKFSICCTFAVPRAVLGDPHAVDDDDGTRPHVDGRHALQLFTRQSAGARYILPFCLAQIVRERLEAVCVVRNKIEIEHWLLAIAKRLVMLFQHQLHDTLEGRNVAGDADLAKLAGDPRLAKCRHLDRILRRCKPLKSALAQRVEYDNRHVA